MIKSVKEHIIKHDEIVLEALTKLNNLAADAILFVVDQDQKLIGSLTDGDVRRGLINNLSVKDNVMKFIQQHPKFIRKSDYNINDIIYYKENNFRIIPIIDDQDRIINILNFRQQKSYLPIDVVIMAGGRGERLRPLTDVKPKPMLKVGDKPILEHNIDNLIKYGADDFYISIKYLGDQIKDYFEDGSKKMVNISYIDETEVLGTIGAVSKIEKFSHDTVLLTNSDLLTNLNYEAFYLDFIKHEADLAILSIPYNVSIPYAILETHDNKVNGFVEKPTYTYYANGGIYLFKKELANLIPKNKFFNATDFMDLLIELNKKVITFAFHGYWLDIGKPMDYEKAQNDIANINFS